MALTKSAQTVYSYIRNLEKEIANLISEICPQCEGEGDIMNPNENEPDEKTCPTCKGRGTV